MIKKIFLVLFVTTLILCCKGKDTSREAVSPQVVPPESQEAKSLSETKDIQKEVAASSDKTRSNHPPRVTSVDLIPLYPKIGDTIKMVVMTADPDGDEVKLIFQWFKNGTPLLETSNTLSLTKEEFRRGDKITLNVIPDDGIVRGSPGFMDVTIGNAPPEITSASRDIKFGDRSFTYQIKAIDPDGDAPTYSLKSGPEGITIDPTTGLIQWNVPPDFMGKTSLTVSVADGHGGEAIQSFTLEITPTKR